MASPGLSYVAEPGTPSTVTALLEARAATTPDAPFVTFEGDTVSYGEIVARADRTAAGLAERGIVPGTKVAVLLPNSLEILETWFACSLMGAVLVPVNTGLLGDGLRYILEHSEAELLVVDDSLLETLERAYPIAAGLSHRFVRGDSGGAPSGYEPYAALTGAGDHGPRATVEPGTLASILYTSGTTGLPKGVMNCHNSYVTAAVEFTHNYVRMREDDVLYTSLPLFHVNAQSLSTLGSIVSGRPLILSPRFSASRFFDDLAAHEATVFNYIGAMLTMLYKQPESPGDAENKVRLTVGGAAPAVFLARLRAALRPRGPGDLRPHRDRHLLLRQPARRHPPRPHRQAGRLGRGQGRRRERRGAAGRRGGRDRRPPAARGHHLPGLLQERGGDRRGDARRLVPHRRPRQPGR